MKEESRARLVLTIDAIILVVGFITVITLLIVPSLITDMVRNYYKENAAELQNALQDVPVEKQEEIRELTIALTEKLIVYIYAIFVIILGILFLVLYSAVTKRSTGQLQCWVLAHCVLLAFAILSTVWTLASTPNLIVYHIPNIIYQAYRVVSVIIIREFRTILRTSSQLRAYNVRYSLT